MLLETPFVLPCQFTRTRTSQVIPSARSVEVVLMVNVLLPTVWLTLTLSAGIV